MITIDIKNKFNISPETYDAQRKYFIPCFDDYYQTAIDFLTAIRSDFNSILDLGAGTGLLSKHLLVKYPNASFTLVDIAGQMLEVAKHRFMNNKAFNFIEADYSQNLPQGKFDLVASALSIHHLSDEEKAALYSSVYNKLPHGGCLLNLDQFNADCQNINDMMNTFWYKQVRNSGISENEFDLWVERRKLDKENTVSETLSTLKNIGYSQVECIYKYFKFGVILAVK